MKLTIKYSFFKELQEAIHILHHPNESQNLRSVIWPTPYSVFSFALSSNNAVKFIKNLWEKNSTKITKAFTKLNLRDPGYITCYLHGISCEGWFNIDDNSIHLRFPKSGGDKELLNTIIHEIIHLSTYDKKFSYHKREAVVEKYIETEEYKKIFCSI